MEGGPGRVGSGGGVFGVYETPVFSQGTSLCKAGTSGSKFHHPSFFLDLQILIKHYSVFGG